MQRVRVRFVDEKGKSREKTFETDSPSELRQALIDRGYFIHGEEIESRSFGEHLADLNPFGQRVSMAELLEFIKLLRTLLKAGLPLKDGLDIMLEEAAVGPLPRALNEVKQDIEEGVSFSRALARHPQVFPNIIVRTIVAGEKAGALEAILERLCDYFHGIIIIRKKLVSAMIYPFILLLVSTAAVSYLLVNVVPAFTDLFKNMGVALPLYTRIVLAIADFLAAWMFSGTIGFIIAGVLLWRFTNTPAGRIALDGFKLNLPLLGRLEERFAFSQMSRTLSTMISGGIPLVESLGVVLDSLENRVVAARLTVIPHRIEQGEGFAKALRAVPGIPSIMTRVVHIGEESGHLSEMLENLADHYDEEIDSLTTRLTSMVEPILFITMALVVGSMIIALLIPMLTAASNIR